jgi:hypothetical protein
LTCRNLKELYIHFIRGLLSVQALQNRYALLNELCFWTLSIVWCLKNKQNQGIKNYRQKITIHMSTNKSHRLQGFMCVCTQVSCSVVSN